MKPSQELSGSSTDLPRAEAPAPAPGLYIHFPWCLSKCPYCDFLSLPSAAAAIPQQDYTRAILAELEALAGYWAPERLETVFVGGGTPSLWEPAELARVLQRLSVGRAPQCPRLDITVECNPSSVTKEGLAALREAGVSRVSLGIQSLDDERLRFLGRRHDCRGALAALEVALSAGFESVSADLIFGVAGQSAATAVEEARTLASLGLDHLSAYGLTIEPQTRFHAEYQRGRLPLLPEEEAAQSFLAVHDALETLGFEHYEISNFGRPGHHSRHNEAYWTGKDYMGVGLGAVGTLPYRSGAPTVRVARHRNAPQLARYFATFLTEAPPLCATLNEQTPWLADFEPLSDEVRFTERIMLGLRLRSGLSLRKAEAELDVSLSTERRREIERLADRGQVLWDGDQLAIPPERWLFSDDVLRRVL